MTTQTTKQHAELEKKIKELQGRIADLTQQSEQILQARDKRSEELVQAYLLQRDPAKLIESQDQDNQKIRAMRQAITTMQADIVTMSREINAEKVKAFILRKAEFNKTLISFMDEHLLPVARKFAEFEKSKDELLSQCAQAGITRMEGDFPYIELQMFDSIWMWLNKNSMPADLARLEEVFPAVFKAARAAK